MKGTWKTDSHGSGVLLLVVVVAVIAAAAAAPIVHAAEDLMRVVLIAVVVSLFGLGIAGAVVAVVLARRARRKPPPWTAQVLPPRRDPQRAVQAPAVAYSVLPPQIHLHLHGPVSAADVVDLIARQGNPQPAIEKEARP